MGNDLGLSSHTNRLKLKMSHNALKVCDQSLCYKSSKFVRAPITSPSSSPLDPSNTSELLPALTKDPQMLGGDTKLMRKEDETVLDTLVTKFLSACFAKLTPGI